MTVPEAFPALNALAAAARKGMETKILHLVHLRASQINGCSFCVQMHWRDAKKEGETDDRLILVAAWREAQCFTPAERAALALTEAATRIADRGEVSDEVWNEAKRHYDEPQLAQLVLSIAMINLWNRVNVMVRQPPF